MKRAEFLKRLGIGAVAVVVAPKIFAQKGKAVSVISSKSGKRYSVIQNEPYWADDGDFSILHVNGKTFKIRKFII